MNLYLFLSRLTCWTQKVSGNQIAEMKLSGGKLIDGKMSIIQFRTLSIIRLSSTIHTLYCDSVKGS